MQIPGMSTTERSPARNIKAHHQKERDVKRKSQEGQRQVGIGRKASCGALGDKYHEMKGAADCGHMNK